jgi:uncharacterized membrane protein YkvA (DUF1232 family)
MIQLSKIMYDQYPKFLVDSTLARKRLALAFESAVDGETKRPFTPVSDQTSATGHQKDAEKGETSEIAMKNQQIRHKRADQQLAANENSEHDLMLQLLSGDMSFIDSIIRAGSAEIRAKDLHAIIGQRELIENKSAAISSEDHQLKDQIRQIMRTLEAGALVNAADPLPAWLAEETFAAQYLLKDEDLIPDTIPGVGLADDAILVKRVVSRQGREPERDFLSHSTSI